MPPRRNKGFTLLELVVALCIFALIGSASYAVLGEIITAQQRLDERADRLAGLQRWLMYSRRDLLQMAPCGLSAPPPVVPAEQTQNTTQLNFCRRGRPNPLGAPRSELEEVEYRLEGSQLTRKAWSPAAGPEDMPQATPLLGGVRAITTRFMDDSRQWRDGWQAADARLPTLMMVEVSVDIESIGIVRQLIPVASVSDADAR
jgi:general secretion pathway protein J